MALKEVEARAPEVARSLRNHLRRIFEYAIDTGLIEDNPIPPVRVPRKRNQQNHPALDSMWVRDFLRRLDATESLNIETRIAMRFVVLTACRMACGRPTTVISTGRSGERCSRLGQTTSRALLRRQRPTLPADGVVRARRTCDA